MVEFPQYVAMDGPEFLYKRAQGIVSMGGFVDSYRQPGVVGSYNRKPIFLWNNDAEMNALLSGDLEALFQMRGYTRAVLDNDPPETPRITIP